MDVIELADDDAPDAGRTDYLVQESADRKKRADGPVAYGVNEKPPACMAMVLALQV